MIDLPERPIFIVGHPRSGTTLLRFMLSSHPRIHIPEETGFVPFLVKDVHARLTVKQARRLLERMGKLNYLWDDLVDDVPAFYDSLTEPTLSHLLDALYREKGASHGASRWGDKTPTYVTHIPLLNELFPTAQFVHVIRDGRDATLSALDKWPERRRYMDNYYLLRNWVRNVRAGRRDGSALGPGCYLEVRYERLVQHPQDVLEKILAFLHEELHPAMLDHTRLARELGPGPQDHVEVQQPISTTSVQRWKREMKPFDQKLANRIAGELLGELGYELAKVAPLSPVEGLKLALLSGRFWLADTARSMLYAAGILTLNRDLRR